MSGIGRQKENDVGVKELMTDLVGGNRSHTFERDGLTLGYTVVGDGQPILFVHGATATGEFEWGRLARPPGVRLSMRPARSTRSRSIRIPRVSRHGAGNLRGSATPRRAPGPRPPPHRGVLLRCRDLAHA